MERYKAISVLERFIKMDLFGAGVFKPFVLLQADFAKLKIGLWPSGLMRDIQRVFAVRYRQRQSVLLLHRFSNRRRNADRMSTVR
jgi:hypothetical protein